MSGRILPFVVAEACHILLHYPAGGEAQKIGSARVVESLPERAQLLGSNPAQVSRFFYAKARVFVLHADLFFADLNM